jgi:hypothetical protein
VSSPRFLSELKRRNVYKIAAAYAVIAWLLIQVAATVLPAFEAPAWVLKFTIVLVALGFPIAVAIAWAFEITPEGIKRTAEVTPEDRRSRGRSWKLPVVTITGAALATALLLLGSERTRDFCVCRFPVNERPMTARSPCCRSRTRAAQRKTRSSRTACKTI